MTEDYEPGIRIPLVDGLEVIPLIFGGLALVPEGSEQKLNLRINHLRSLLDFLMEYVPYEESKFVYLKLPENKE